MLDHLVAQERVQRGMSLLDEKCPGWMESIDPAILDLSSNECCILGQAFGNHYADGISAVFGFDVLHLQDWEFAMIIHHGFSVREEHEWRIVEYAWLCALSDRVEIDADEHVEAVPHYAPVTMNRE